MRIIFITTKLNFRTAGGSIEEFDLMMRTWQGLGHEVTAVTTMSQNNDLTEPLPYALIEERIRTDSLWQIQTGIYRLLKKYEDRADFFHVDGQMFLYGAGLYRRLGGKTPVEAYFNRELACWPENTSSLFPKHPTSVLRRTKKKVRWLIEKYLGMPIANGIDVLTCVCPPFRDEYEKFGLKKGALAISDPVDFKKIMAEGNVTEGDYVRRIKTDGPLTIFYSSRMVPGKGFDILLTGFSKVKNKERFRVILGGNGPEEPFVRDMIKRYNLEPFVHLTGWTPKERVYEMYRQADIFIQPEWLTYGTSISLLYAMCFGVPSILPGGGGLQWVAGDAAEYFRYRDTDDLARAIERLAEHPERRAELSHNATRRLRHDDLNYDVQLRRVLMAMEDVRRKS